MGTVFALPRSRHARTVLMCGKLQEELSEVSAQGDSSPVPAPRQQENRPRVPCLIEGRYPQGPVPRRGQVYLWQLDAVVTVGRLPGAPQGICPYRVVRLHGVCPLSGDEGAKGTVPPVTFVNLS